MHFYGYNGAIFLGRFGTHFADWEHITMVYDWATKTPLYYYFAAHGSDTGHWIRATGVEWDGKVAGNKVVVYVAKNSHASYTQEGTWWRFWIGLANDVTGKGHRWEPDSFVFLKENEPVWMKYRGKFGLYSFFVIRKQRKQHTS